MTVEAIDISDGVIYAEMVAAEVRGMAAKKKIPSTRLALALGISPMAMSRRMTGKLPFAVDELAIVAGVLGVPVETLLPHLDSNQKPIEYQSAAGQLTIPFRARGAGIMTPMREQLADVIDLDARRAVA